jgi:hypothetical protein
VAILKNHKTKLVGLLLVTAGALQATSPQVQMVISPKAFAVFTIVTGLVVAVLGFVNTQLAKDDEPDSSV